MAFLLLHNYTDFIAVFIQERMDMQRYDWMMVIGCLLALTRVVYLKNTRWD